MQVTDRATNAALAAGASERPFADRTIGIAPFDGYLQVGLGGGALLTGSVLIDGRAVVFNSPLPTLTAYPTRDQMIVENEEVFAGQRIEIEIHNPTAGALAAFWYAQLSSVPRTG